MVGFNNFIVVIAIFIGFSLAQAPSTLRLVHLVFRHGDRSPTKTFPTDPHQEDAWPQGFGQLSKLGMRQEYDLGLFLRKRYTGFLNSTYIRQEIYVRSTDLDRTLMSAATLLAGMYPPQSPQLWNSEIQWQPIPIHTVPFETDKLLKINCPCRIYDKLKAAVYKSLIVHEYEHKHKLSFDTVCPKYNVSVDEAYQSNEVLMYVKDNKEFLDIIREKSGMTDSSLYEVMDVIPNAVFCERAYNMTLPDWVTPDVFDRLQELKDFQLKLWFYTPEMQKIRAGVFLDLLVNHTREKAEGKAPETMKMYMFSGHDTTLAAIMMALSNFNGKLPPYGSTVMFELHQRSTGDYFVKLLYKNDSTSNMDSVPIPLSIRGCETECDLHNFYEVVKPMVYEGDWFADCENKKPSAKIYKGVPIAIAVCAIVIVVILVVVVIVCYKRKSGEIAYQSANFSNNPGSA